MRQSPFWNRVWKPAVIAFAGDQWVTLRDAAGRPQVVVTKRGPGKHPRIHDLRHTFASWAIQSNVPLPVIQRQLGHESITTTIGVYGGMIDQISDDTLERLDQILDPALPASGQVVSGSVETSELPPADLTG